MSCQKCEKDAEFECSWCCRVLCSEECYGAHQKNGDCQYFGDIQKETLKNDKKGPVIIYEDPSGRMQIGLSSIDPGESIDWETHKDMSQFARVEQGYGMLYVGDKFKQTLHAGIAFIIPSGTRHKITCENLTLKFYTIYSKNTDDKWEH